MWTFFEGPLDVPGLFGDGVQTPVQRGDEQEGFWEGDGSDPSNLMDHQRERERERERERGFKPAA